ncbi:MAG: hypothetical protein CSH37_11630 [Thalassolituus sp.]|nr:MAG: hypothetical protein CSH37_11630 [Thalassolituus sp.]
MTMCQYSLGFNLKLTAVPNDLVWINLVATRSRSTDEKRLRRESILDAAEQAFIDRRFDKASMGSIASSAGLSRALLYVYFRDKEDIHLGLSVRAAKRLLTLMADFSSPCPNGISSMYAIGQAYLYFYHNEKEYFRILTLSAGMRPSANQTGADSTDSEREYIQIDEDILELMVNAIQRAYDDRSLQLPGTPNPVEVALYMRGSLHGLIMLQDGNRSLFEAHKVTPETWLENSLNMIARSLTQPVPPDTTK